MGSQDLRVWRYVLFALMLGVLGITMLGVIASARSNAETIMREHAREQMQQVATATADSTKRFLAPAERSVRLTRQLLETHVLALNDDAVLEHYFLGQLRTNPELTGMYFGRPNGEFVFVRRTQGAFSTKRIQIDPSGRHVSLVHRDQAWHETGRERLLDDTFDPRKRPWYRAALKSAQPIWTDPYIFFSSRRPGITSAVVVRDPKQQLLGVTGVDLEIGELSMFLKKLPVSTNGQAFIMDRQSAAVAAPTLTGSLGELARLPRLDQLGGPPMRQLLGSDAPSDPDTANLQTFHVGSSTYFGMLQPLTLAGGIHWTVGVHAPATDFLGDLRNMYDRQLHDITLIFLLAALIAVPIAFLATHPVIRLHRMATVDDLTGLYNRPEFRRRAEALMRRARTQSRPVSVAMLDLDGFKGINDAHGHPVGDEVLAQVGVRLASLTDEGTLVARLGGDEFVIFMTGADANLIVDRAHRLVSADIMTKAGAQRVGVTIGLAFGKPGSSVRELLSQADHALVQGKMGDKNRTYQYAMLN